MKLYRIKDWMKIYEVSDSKKVDGPLTWVAIRTKQDGFGFRRIAAERDRTDLLAAWILMVEIAARQRRGDRGKLMRDGRPLNARSLATMTGFPENIFVRGLEFFCDPEQDWMESEEVPDQSASPAASARAEGAPEGSAAIPALSGPVRIYPAPSESILPTGQDSTLQDIRETSSPSSSPAAGATDGQVLPGMDPSALRNEPVKFFDVIALYNELCPSMPRARLSEERKKSIRARWQNCDRDKVDPIEWFRGLFTKAEASDFLSGRKTASGTWRCGLDWLIGPKNAQKVVEGNYDNIQGARQLSGPGASWR